MKKFIFLVIIALASITSVYAQDTSTTTSSKKQTEVLVPRFKLVPTTNMWIFLKLDTSQGIVHIVQYNTNEKKRFEAPINFLPLVSGDDAIPGRFNLYPTQNMWTFILLDEIDGNIWQVQWSLDGETGIVPIRSLVTFDQSELFPTPSFRQE